MCPAKINTITQTKQGFSLCFNKGDEENHLQAKVVVKASGPWVNELHEFVTSKVNSLDIDLVQCTHIILDVTGPSGIYYIEANDQRAVFVMPYDYNGVIKTMVGTTEKLLMGKADDVHATDDEVDYLLNVSNAYFSSATKSNVIQQFSGLRVLPNHEGSTFSRPRDTTLHWSLPGMLSLYGGKLTAYRYTSELVINKLKPLLGKRRCVAYTE